MSAHSLSAGMMSPPTQGPHRWLGVPRWVWLAAAAGLVAFLGVYGPWTQPSPQVRAIVAGLRTSSVYQEPGAPPLVNAARARQAIGNRPILVVLLNRTPLPPSSKNRDPRLVLCEQITAVIPDDYVWVYAADGTGQYKGNNCYGSDFPPPSKPGVSMNAFDAGMNNTAQLSAQYETTSTNLTPEIEEFVLSFDDQTTDDYGAIPTRSVLPNPLAGRQIVLACVGMVLGTIAVFLLLRLGGRLLLRGTARAAAWRRRHAELSARLSSVADAVINPPEPADAQDARRQADIAKRYVAALDHLEHAHTDDELTGLEQEIDSLTEETLG